jgi:putative nucleotidyltransferase with HDIG domain
MSEATSILIVDDEQSVRTLCREFLESFDYHVVEAENGTEALRKMSEQSFSLILSDILMPDINGLELTSIIRSKYPDTLVILISGYGTIDLAKDAILRGAFDFVTKPFKMDELRNMVERAIEVRKKQLSVLPSPELKDLYNLTVNVNISDQSVQVYLNSLMAILKKTFRGDSGRIYLLEKPGGKSLVRKAGSGSENKVSDDIWEQVSRAALESDSGVLDDRDSARWISDGFPVSSFMAVPIPSSEGNLGTCLVTRSDNPASFSSRDLKLMGLFTAQAGNQLLNYRMTSNLRDQALKLETVNLLAGEFASSLSIQKVISSISLGLRSMVQFDLFGVYLSGKDMVPLSYMLVRSDLPRAILQKDFLKILQKTQDINDINQFLEYSQNDSFSSTSKSDWNISPMVELQDLGDFGSFKGMIVLASWNKSAVSYRESSHILLLLKHAAAALSNAYLFESNERNYIQTISALASAVDAKDPYTHNHSRNVAAYATSIAAHIDLTSREITLLNNAALLHDIGKIGIPEVVLNKNGPLTDEEFDLIKTHPVVGYNILKPITAFSSFIDAVRFHHEKYDGSGYPDGLKSLDIPFQARILAVADAFDAMSSDRVYRKSLGLKYAMSELRKNIGSQFDPSIGKAFISVLSLKSPEEIVCDYMSSRSNQLALG